MMHLPTLTHAAVTDDARHCNCCTITPEAQHRGYLPTHTHLSLRAVQGQFTTHDRCTCGNGGGAAAGTNG